MTKEELIKLLKDNIDELENSIIDDSDYELMDDVMTPLSLNDYSTFSKVNIDDVVMLLSMVYDEEEEIDEKVEIFFRAILLGQDVVTKFVECITDGNNKNFKRKISKSNSELKKDLNAVFKDIYKKMKEIKNDIDNQRKYKNKAIQNYKEIINIISNSSNIIDFDKISKLKIDENVKYEVLVYILNHNAIINRKLCEQNGKFHSNDKLKIKALFNQYNYDNMSSVDIEKLLVIAPKLLEEKLKLLSQITFDDEYLVQILLYAKIECIENIINIFSKNILDLKNIAQHINILFDEDNSNIYPMYTNFMNNIELFKSKEFSIHNLNNHFNILLMDYEILFNNIKLLEKYGFDLKNLTNFNLLENISILDMVDGFIEQNLYDYILNNQQIIKSDYDIIIRLIITKYLQLPIFNKNNRIVTSITSGKGFEFDIDYVKGIIKNDVESYINEMKVLKNSRRDFIIDDIYNLDIIKRLEQFKINDVVLNIDNQFISYNKVLRNFSTLYLNNPNGDMESYLFDSLLYGSIIEEENIKMIKDKIIKNKVYKK